MNRKRGQMNLSFGMIFGILLIIVFIAFAFYAIQKVLSIQKTVEAGKFTSDLQNDIDQMWRGVEGSQQYEFPLPTDVKKICITDFSANAIGANSNLYHDLNKFYSGTENLFFYPPGSGEGFDAITLKNINLIKTTANENPLCFDNVDGKIKLIVKKDFGENLVTMSR
jgi:hypothetical protein